MFECCGSDAIFGFFKTEASFSRQHWHCRKKMARVYRKKKSKTGLIVAIIIIVVIVLVAAGLLIYFFLIRNRSTETATCVANSDCATGEICSNGTCITQTGCTTNAQCPSGQICSSGTCVIDETCTVDGDCDTGEVCFSGECIPDDGCSGPPPTPTGISATTNGVTGNQVLSWTASAGALAYDITYTGTATVSHMYHVPGTVEVLGGATTSYEIGLPHGTFSATVVAKNSCGNSAPSSAGMWTVTTYPNVVQICRNSDPDQCVRAPTTTGQPLTMRDDCENDTLCNWRWTYEPVSPFTRQDIQLDSAPTECINLGTNYQSTPQDFAERELCSGSQDFGTVGIPSQNRIAIQDNGGWNLTCPNAIGSSCQYLNTDFAASDSEDRWKLKTIRHIA